MSKHTLGPWSAFPPETQRGHHLIQHCNQINQWKSVAVAYRAEDARLIQAAPDLLEALREALPILDSMDISREEGDEEMPIIAKARAAINKAVGATTPTVAATDTAREVADAEAHNADALRQHDVKADQ